MRIVNVHIQNFRGVRTATLTNLGDLVVIAGQNGSGKSCILDAIRLIKSIYGGYQPNEFHQWFGEFQINFANDPQAFRSLFNDPSKLMVLQLEFQIHEEEREYLKKNADALIRKQTWRAIIPEVTGWRNIDAAPLAAHYRAREHEIEQAFRNDFELFEKEIDQISIVAQVTIAPGEFPRFRPSKLLELIFSTFEPEHIGIIDYHGPHRMYGREQIHAINVNLTALEDQKKQTALYNYNAKYTNIKSEMAALYVREALAEKAGVSTSGRRDLTQTLGDLFTTFFPDKEFLGPQPTLDGSLRFPVKVGGKETHDLDDLSSGEKEILYGYLRLRNSAPKNAVILLDEPELHLNPRLTRNLPDFYYRNLARPLGNQVWLITHSDGILRESVGRNGVSVFHLTPAAYADIGRNQATLVAADQDLERAVIELVGDLAAYSPDAKIVIFEGEDSDFDVKMTSELFPQLHARVNAISGSNKNRVRGLHSLLERLQSDRRLPPMRIYSITDRDSDTGGVPGANQLSWNVYHIENYLLESEIISEVSCEVLMDKRAMDAESVEKALKECAYETVSSLIAHEVSAIANRKIVTAINTRISPASKDIVGDLARVLNASRQRIETILDEELSKAEIGKIFAEKREKLLSDIESGEWKKTFRGRDILKLFAGKYIRGLNYEIFRNLIIARMRDRNHQPLGMKILLDEIFAPEPLARCE